MSIEDKTGLIKKAQEERARCARVPEKIEAEPSEGQVNRELAEAIMAMVYDPKVITEIVSRRDMNEGLSNGLLLADGRRDDWPDGRWDREEEIGRERVFLVIPFGLEEHTLLAGQTVIDHYFKDPENVSEAEQKQVFSQVEVELGGVCSFNINSRGTREWVCQRRLEVGDLIKSHSSRLQDITINIIRLTQGRL